MTAPVVASRGQARTTAVDVTSHAITLPTGIVAGNLLIVVFSVDGAPTVTAPAAWTKVGQTTDATNAVTGAVFWKVAAGGDTCTLTTSTAEQSSHITFRVTGGASVQGASSSGSSTNSAPPPLGLEGPADHLWILTRSGDSTVVATAAPSGTTPLSTIAAVGTLSASTNTAEAATLSSTTAEPGPFTSATEQWVSWTLQVHPPNPKIGTLVESFSGALTTPPWTPYDANTAFTGGQLVQTIPASSVEAAALIYGGNRWDATGSAVFCEVVEYPALPNSHYTRPLLLMTPGLSNGMSFYLWQGDIYVFHDTLAVLAGPVTYDPVAMRWLKFRITGANYFFETAPDAVTWTVFHTGTVASLGIPMTDVLFLIQSVVDAAEPAPSVTRFDNLNIPPGGTGATGRPKVWTGSAHVQKPGKVWNGSAWVEKPWKAWTGTEWKKLT